MPVKWVFDAKPGEVSPLYECGENDHLLVVALEAINPAGYVNINKVSDMLRSEVLRNKKAEQIMGQMKGFNSLAQVKGMKDAISDTVKHVTFNAPAFISVTRASEPAISAYASKTELNKVSAPIKGNAGVYMIQVYNQEKSAEKFDAKKEETALSNMAARYAGQCIYELRDKAEIVDQRYLFF
jgi:peptidyl-prolyl cis-trans isomerase D